MRHWLYRRKLGPKFVERFWNEETRAWHRVEREDCAVSEGSCSSTPKDIPEREWKSETEKGWTKYLHQKNRTEPLKKRNRTRRWDCWCTGTESSTDKQHKGIPLIPECLVIVKGTGPAAIKTGGRKQFPSPPIGECCADKARPINISISLKFPSQWL